MNRPLRLLAIGVAVVALSLTGLGIGLAATSAGPSDGALALHGRVANTATASFVISTNQQNEITGTYEVNFNNGDMAGTLNVPTLFSTTHVAFRLVNGVVYLGVPNFASIIKTPWVSIPLKKGAEPSLFPFAFELSDLGVDIPEFLTKPVTETHNGAWTTYDKVFHQPIVVPKTVPLTLPSRVSENVSITLASKGQLAAASVVVTATHFYFSAAVTIDSYNEPVHVVAPPAKLVQPLTPSLVKSATGSSSSPYAKLFSPQGLSSLGQIRLG